MDTQTDEHDGLSPNVVAPGAQAPLRWGKFHNEFARKEWLGAAPTAILAYRHMFAGKWGTRLDSIRATFRGSMSRKTFQAAIRELQHKGLWERQQVGRRFAKETLTAASNPKSYRRVEATFFDGKLSWKEVAVLLYVRAHSNCSTRDVADRFDWGTRTARQHLDALVDAGRISKLGTAARPLYHGGQDAEIAASARERFAPRSVQKGVRRRVLKGGRRSVQKRASTLSVNPTADERIPKAGTPAASDEFLDGGIEQNAGTGSAKQQPKAPSDRAKGQPTKECSATGEVPTLSREVVDLAHKHGLNVPEFLRRLLEAIHRHGENGNPIRNVDGFARRMIDSEIKQRRVRCNVEYVGQTPARAAPAALPLRPPPIVATARNYLAERACRYDEICHRPRPRTHADAAL